MAVNTCVKKDARPRIGDLTFHLKVLEAERTKLEESTREEIKVREEIHGTEARKQSRKVNET